ncbi:MAG: aa3-type cytochrome c oxidase subunit IV [Alphaproteobacteria bacterium]|nr:aa3-type cytochrome c oxidase subunit IV [Alphaproteobacteria bacterium]MBV9062020.1 aa3-type cytochrome c oxidase subunit IV [Alphaproteobacteria bacterium]
MAEHAGQEPSPDFMKEHLRTWIGFLKLIKWLIIGSIVLLLVLLIWRTHNG